MAGLGNGCYAFVSFVGEGLWREGFILARVEGAECVVMTPDYDTFMELLDPTNDDLDCLCFVASKGSLPEALPTYLTGQELYRFRERMDVYGIQTLLCVGARMDSAKQLARVLIGRGCRNHGIVGEVVTPPVELVAGATHVPVPRVAGPDGAWVVDEAASGMTVGQVLELPADALQPGRRALVGFSNGVVSLTFLEAGTDIDEWVCDRLNGIFRAYGCFLPKFNELAEHTLDTLLREVAFKFLDRWARRDDPARLVFDYTGGGSAGPGTAVSGLHTAPAPSGLGKETANEEEKGKIKEARYAQASDKECEGVSRGAPPEGMGAGGPCGTRQPLAACMGVLEGLRSRGPGFTPWRGL